jgi:hypothetical protein
MFSNEVWRKGTRQFVGLRSLLDVGLLQDDEELETPLPSHSMGSGVVGIDGISITPMRSSVY